MKQVIYITGELAEKENTREVKSMMRMLSPSHSLPFSLTELSLFTSGPMDT